MLRRPGGNGNATAAKALVAEGDTSVRLLDGVTGGEFETTERETHVIEMPGVLHEGDLMMIESSARMNVEFDRSLCSPSTSVNDGRELLMRYG